MGLMLRWSRTPDEGMPEMRGPKVWRRLPMLVRFVLCHAVLGFGIAAVATAAFVLVDPGGGGGILLNAAGHWWPVVVLWFFLGLTFGSAQIGAATMLLANKPEEPRRPGGGKRVPIFSPALVPIPAPTRR